MVFWVYLYDTKQKHIFSYHTISYINIYTDDDILIRGYCNGHAYITRVHYLEEDVF